MPPVTVSQQANVHENDEQDTTQEPNASNHDKDSYSDLKNLKLDNDESRKEPHHSSTMPDNIPNKNHQVKVFENSEKEDVLVAGELDYDADRNSFNYLINDDCLLHIFSFLPLRDLIRIERVCKRWQKLSSEPLRKVKIVNILKDFNLSSVQKIPLEQILSRCGSYITALEFNLCKNLRKSVVTGLESNKQLQADEAMKLINKYCKRLDYLNTCSTFFTDQSYLNLLDDNILKNLKSLAIGNHWKYHDEQLSDVLKKCVNLKEFTALGYVFWGHALMNLTTNCETLAVTSSRKFCDRILIKVLEKYTNLENLDISGTIIDPYTLLPFTDQFKCLALCSMENFFKVEINTFNDFHFPNLRVLDVSYNIFTSSEILSVLITNCPNIEDLRLKMCRTLKFTDFDFLKEVKNLMYLDVSYTDITNQTLINLSKTFGKLKKLECNGCSNIKTIGVRKVIAASPELSYLFIPLSVLTVELIESALVSLRERNNKVDLIIGLGPENDKKLIAEKIEKLELKSLSYERNSKNVMRIVWGSVLCDCNFDKTCFCLKGLDIMASFG